MKQMSFYLIIIYVLLSACVGTSAQTLTFDFQDTPLADALTAIRDSQQDYTFHFIHNDLEGLTVTSRIRNQGVEEAVKRVCKGQPVKMKTTTSKQKTL